MQRRPLVASSDVPPANEVPIPGYKKGVRGSPPSGSDRGGSGEHRHPSTSPVQAAPRGRGATGDGRSAGLGVRRDGFRRSRLAPPVFSPRRSPPPLLLRLCCSRGRLVAIGVGLRPGDRLAELVFGLLHQGHGLGAITTEIMVGVLELIRRLSEIGHRRADVRVALWVPLRHWGRVLAEPEHRGAEQ